MAAPVSVSRAASLGLSMCGALSFMAPLLTRLAEGNAFFLTGRGKLEHFENFVTFFTELGIPFPEINAHVVARIEYYGAILLILGLFTRLAAAGLLSTMVVALLTADRVQFLESWKPTGDVGPLDIAAFVNLLLLTWLVLYGPGPLSLDTFVKRWLGLAEGVDERGAGRE